MSDYVRIDATSLFVLLTRFDLADRGLLVSILAQMWSCEGHIEDDPKQLARITGARQKRLAAFMQKAVQHKIFDIRNGRVYPGERTQRMISRAQLSAAQREAVLRDATACAYCGAEDGPFVVDHIYPASRGGTNHRRNLIAACRTCNADKRDQEPDVGGWIT